MKVRDLIKQLKKLPQDAEVGYSHHDNREWEVAGWVDSARYIVKDEYVDKDEIDDRFERQNFEHLPQGWVILR